MTFYGVAGGLGFTSWLFSPYAKETAIGRAAQESFAWRWVVAQLDEMSKPFSEPSREKLLPDWPFFPNLPPDHPCPPTLVLDLEGTLVKSTWDKKYGWRHAKRPGVDKFLLEMSRYYEIVFFSPNIAGNAEPIMLMLDKVIGWPLLPRRSRLHVAMCHGATSSVSRPTASPPRTPYAHAARTNWCGTSCTERRPSSWAGCM